MTANLRNKYPRWSNRHEGVLRWLFEHPEKKQRECAKALNYSPSQISRITNSPDYKMRYKLLAEKEFSRIIQSRITANL